MLSAQKVAEITLESIQMKEGKLTQIIETVLDEKITKAAEQGKFSVIVKGSDFIEESNNDGIMIPDKLLKSIIYEYESNGFKISTEISLIEPNYRDDMEFINLENLKIFIDWKKEIKNL